MKLAPNFAFLLLALPASLQAWSAEEWTQRTVVTLNTSTAGVAAQETQNNLAVPVRLHSGNFDFASAKPDGSDLWVMAGDNKTPLQFWVERFDGVNELGVVWVLVPSILPATDKNTVYVYSGNAKPAAAASTASSMTAIADAATLAAFHFSERDGLAADQSGAIKAGAATPLDVNGLIGQSARVDATPIVWPASDKLKFNAGAPFTIAFWVKPDAADGTLFRQGPLSVTLAAGKLAVNAGATVLNAGIVTPGTWTQVAVTAGGGKLDAYVNGAPAGEAALAAGPAISGEVRLGEGVHGLFDELELASVARSAEWIRIAYAAQSADAKLLASRTENAESADSGGSTSYFGILFKSLTPDAWAIIIILMLMFFIAVAVMVTKFMYVSRTEKANERFITLFRGASDVMKVDEGTDLAELKDSSLHRLYQAGLTELVKRNIGGSGGRLSGASMDAVKAAIDADSVREGYSLNSAMVLLTIAISGGPFLGLLGTVVGVMITFASIAAAGDVNVNAIAPGIAAALLATVAGLSVAIPSLFGYNYLASRIKTISSDMQIFIDEFVTRVAETYGAL
jgi:biopolymer transport protein ExbB